MALYLHLPLGHIKIQFINVFHVTQEHERSGCIIKGFLVDQKNICVYAPYTELSYWRGSITTPIGVPYHGSIDL